MLSIATSHPIRPGTLLAASLGGVGALLMTLSAGTMVRGDTYSTSSAPSGTDAPLLNVKHVMASLNKLELIGQFLVLAAVAIGFASFVGVLFASGATLARTALKGGLGISPLNPFLRKARASRNQAAWSAEQRTGLLSALLMPWQSSRISSRFSVTWAIWRGPRPIGGYLILLGVALATLWVYVFIPRLSLGAAQGLFVNLAAGIIVIVRIGAKNRIFSDLKGFRKDF